MASKFHNLFVILLLCLIKTVLMKAASILRKEKDGNIDRRNLSDENHQITSLKDSTLTISTLTISTRHYEPYMYQHRNGSYYHGIEYKLAKTIAEKLNIELTFQTTSRHSSVCSNVLLK